MANYKITYCYDGSNFWGSQRQQDKRTVQGEIEKAIKIITKKDINLITAGRTDRGVHASFQVSNFVIDTPIPKSKFKFALSNILPCDIVLFDLTVTSDDFHARFDAIMREYTYKITNVKSPFTANYMTFIPKNIDIQKFYDIMKVFVGRHNFANFSLKDDKKRNTMREIYDINISQNNTEIIIKILGNAFLKSQIRVMIGMALNVLLMNRSKNDLIKLLDTDIQKIQKIVAPHNGLYLSNIIYKD